jgi:hypothetical protein
MIWGERADLLNVYQSEVDRAGQKNENSDCETRVTVQRWFDIGCGYDQSQ